jgi:hypothetical protein
VLARVVPLSAVSRSGRQSARVATDKFCSVGQTNAIIAAFVGLLGWFAWCAWQLHSHRRAEKGTYSMLKPEALPSHDLEDTACNMSL